MKQCYRRWLSCFLSVALSLVATATAAATVSVCFNYGCISRQPVQYTSPVLKHISRHFIGVSSAQAERQSILKALAELYRLAGRQSPISADRGGNLHDDGVRGRMDCIDHATTTTAFLQLMTQQGWLHYHRVLPPVRRSFLIFQHFSAVIEEHLMSVPQADPVMAARYKGGNVAAPRRQTAAQFVVDSWFVDHGKWAVILPLEDWKRGAGPNVQ